jgi:hypothetical protein
MANTLNGVNLGLVAQRSVPPLKRALFVVNNFFNDFSDEIVQPGASITTRVPVLGSTSDFTSGITLSNAQTNSITVTLSQEQGYAVGFTNAEVTKSAINLTNLFEEPAMWAVARNITDTALSLFTAANYSGNKVVALSSFNGDVVANLAMQLTQADVPDDGNRWLLLSPAAYAQLAQDQGIKYAYAYGSNSVIMDNRIPKVHGFTVGTYNGIPDPDSVGMFGIAGYKNGVVIASRKLAEPDYWFGQTEYVAEDESRLNVQLQYFYDGMSKKNILAAETLYGVSVGVAANCIRLTTS